MPFTEIVAGQRMIKRAMARAIRGSPIRAIVELALNSDDSYKRLEDRGISPSGRIEIELDRKYENSTLTVRDFAEGMSYQEAIEKMRNWGGDDQSGQGIGGSARGFYSRGAKDALFEMEGGRIETIKGGVLTTIEFVTKNETKRGLEHGERLATALERRRLGILKGNGTVASFRFPDRTPQFEKLRSRLQGYYMLRKLNSDPKRSVVLKYKDKDWPLTYNDPAGVCGEPITLQLKVGHFDFELTTKICLAESALDQSATESREGGLLIVDEQDACLDLSLFKYGFDPDAEKIFGEVVIKGLRLALRTDENILTEERDGLNTKDEIAAALIKAIEDQLEPVVAAERERNAGSRKKLSVSAQQRVNALLDELNRIAAEYTEQGAVATTADGKLVKGGKLEETPPENRLPDTLEIVPGTITLRPGQPNVITVRINTHKCIGEAIVTSDTDEVDFSPDGFEVDKSIEIWEQQIELRCEVPGVSGIVTVTMDNGEATCTFKVEEALYPVPSLGIEFIPAERRLTINRSQTLDLYVDLKRVPAYTNIVFEVEKGEVVQLNKTSARVDPAKARNDIVHIPISLVGTQINGRTRVIATAEPFFHYCDVFVHSKRQRSHKAGGFFRDITWDDHEFPKCSYREEDQTMVIHTKEPSFAYLGVSETSFDDNSAVQVAVAEAITREASSKIAERTPPGSPRRPFYLNPGDAVKRMSEDRAWTERLISKIGPSIYRAVMAMATPKKVPRG